jgi:hypothetical protein
MQVHNYNWVSHEIIEIKKKKGICKAKNMPGFGITKRVNRFGPDSPVG